MAASHCFLLPGMVPPSCQYWYKQNRSHPYPTLPWPHIIYFWNNISPFPLTCPCVSRQPLLLTLCFFYFCNILICISTSIQIFLWCALHKRVRITLLKDKSFIPMPPSVQSFPLERLRQNSEWTSRLCTLVIHTSPGTIRCITAPSPATLATEAFMVHHAPWAPPSTGPLYPS